MDVVFVHLNTPLPSYLNNNLDRMQKLFPKENIVLISNIVQRIIPGITFYKLQESLQSEDLRKTLSHPAEFRNNFWHSSIARFAYLLTYQKESNNRIIHFESDVLVSKDFPLSKFKRMSTNKIAFPILAPKRGVASVFYSGSAKSLDRFVSFAVCNARENTGTTDMLTLRDFYDQFPKLVTILPAGPPNIELYCDQIVQDIYPKIRAGFKTFQGVFDGTDIGFYLFGTNPWNRLGVSLLHQELEETYTIMSKFKFKYNSRRDFVDIISENKIVPVYNLHITSKQKSLFKFKDLDLQTYKHLNVRSETKRIYLSVFFTMLFNKFGKLFAKFLNT